MKPTHAYTDLFQWLFPVYYIGIHHSTLDSPLICYLISKYARMYPIKGSRALLEQI